MALNLSFIIKYILFVLGPELAHLINNGGLLMTMLI